MGELGDGADRSHPSLVDSGVNRRRRLIGMHERNGGGPSELAQEIVDQPMEALDVGASARSAAGPDHQRSPDTSGAFEHHAQVALKRHTALGVATGPEVHGPMSALPASQPIRSGPSSSPRWNA